MRIRFYAVGREIAGCAEYLAEANDVQALRAELEQRFGPRMGQLFDAASMLHNGKRVSSTATVRFADDAIVDLLPPFAGG